MDILGLPIQYLILIVAVAILLVTLWKKRTLAAAENFNGCKHFRLTITWLGLTFSKRQCGELHRGFKVNGSGVKGPRVLYSGSSKRNGGTSETLPAGTMATSGHIISLTKSARLYQILLTWTRPLTRILVTALGTTMLTVLAITILMVAVITTCSVLT